MSKKTTLRLAALASALALGGCVTPGGGTISAGTAPTAATGARAGGATSVNANPSLSVAMRLWDFGRGYGRGKEWYASFGAATKITTIEPLIRLAVQQSNCFVITSIGNNRLDSRMSAITDKQRNSGGVPLARASKRASAWPLTTTWSHPSSSTTTQPASWLQALAVCSAMWARWIGGAMQSKASVVTLSDVRHPFRRADFDF